MRFLSSIAYRFEVLTSALTHLVLLVAAVFLWKIAYRGVPEAAGVNEKQMIAYTIVSMLLMTLFTNHVHFTIHNRVRDGSIAVDFLRPLQLLGFFFAEDLGASLSAFFNKVLPLLLFATIFFFAPLPTNPLALLLFIPSIILSYGILWLLSALVGLISFWVLDLGNFGGVKDALVRALSGSLLPIWFFPPWLAKISAYLPFQYTYQTPLGIFIGRTDPGEALHAMFIQTAWLLTLFLLLIWVWSRARKKILVQGG